MIEFRLQLFRKILIIIIKEKASVINTAKLKKTTSMKEAMSNKTHK